MSVGGEPLSSELLASQAPLGEMLAAQMSIGALVRRGAFWSIGGYGAAQLLRLVGNLIMTRLLVPEAFGTMALVLAVQQGLQMLSDVGLGVSVVRGSRGEEPRFLDTVWTVQVVRGFVLFGIAALIAVPTARFYGDPSLASVLIVTSLGVVIGGFNSTDVHTLYRRVDLARIAVFEIVGQAAGLVVTLVWAWFDPSIWALVAGGLFGSVGRLVLSHTMLGRRPCRFALERRALVEITRLGRWVLFSTMLTFLVGQTDRLVFGKLVPLEMLGVYSVGALIAGIPALALSRLASSVFFPVYSRVHNMGGDLAAAFVRVRRPLLVGAGWAIAGLAGGGAAAVRLLYDERYESAGWIVQVLALASWFLVLEATNGAALLARGQANWTAACSAAKLVGMAVMIPLGYAWGGFPGAVIGLATSEVLKYAVSAYAASRAGLPGRSQELLHTGWVFVTALFGWWLANTAYAAHWSRFAEALLVLAGVTIAWAPLAIARWSNDRARLQTELG